MEFTVCMWFAYSIVQAEKHDGVCRISLVRKRGCNVGKLQLAFTIHVLPLRGLKNFISDACYDYFIRLGLHTVLPKDV